MIFRKLGWFCKVPAVHFRHSMVCPCESFQFRALMVLLSRLAFWMDISCNEKTESFHSSTALETCVPFRNNRKKLRCKKFPTNTSSGFPPHRHQRKFMWIPQRLQGNGVHLGRSKFSTAFHYLGISVVCIFPKRSKCTSSRLPKWHVRPRFIQIHDEPAFFQKLVNKTNVICK